MNAQKKVIINFSRNVRIVKLGKSGYSPVIKNIAGAGFVRGNVIMNTEKSVIMGAGTLIFSSH